MDKTTAWQAPAGALHLRVEVLDGLTTVVLDGDLDMANAPSLDRLLARLRSDGVSRVTLDMASVRFIDSSGLRSLLVAARPDGSGFHLKVVEPSLATRQILEVTGTLNQLTS